MSRSSSLTLGFRIASAGKTMTNLLQDLRLAIRQLRRSPGFVFAAVLILALGIAANVIVFGVLQGLILRPLEVPHPERVKQLARTNQAYPMFSIPELRDICDNNTVFSAVGACTIWTFGLETNGVSRPIVGYEVSGQYFEVAAIKPLLGRLLDRTDDDHPGASDAVVLSWSAWKSYFGADPNIAGKKVRLNKHPYTIVGVTPEGFYGTEKFLQPDIFVPVANEASLEGVNWLEQRDNLRCSLVVRFKDGATLPQVEAQLKTIADRMKEQNPKDEEELGLKLVNPGFMGELLGSPLRGFLLGVLGLAGIVLLAACANLGGLFAARTLDRTREVAIRISIGSSRWRILRQVFVEAVLLSMLGGVCACGLSWIALTALANWNPPGDIPFRLVVLPQPSLLVIALLVSILAALLFGLVPLRQLFRTDPNEALKIGSNQSSPGRRWSLRDALLAAQIELCCLILTAAFVSLRGLNRAMTMDIGFNPKNVVRTTFDLTNAGYFANDADHFQRQLLERASQLPGVKAAGYTDRTPLSLRISATDVFSENVSDLRLSKMAFHSYFYSVSPGYFAASGIPVLAGRDVSFTDSAKGTSVAVVNREFARELFHSDRPDDAIGRYFKNEDSGLVQIVGVVVNQKYLTLSEDPEPCIYFPISQRPQTSTVFVVRTGPDPTGTVGDEMAATIRKLIRELDPAIPIRESGAWARQLNLAIFPAQTATIALSLFGGFGVLLSIAGTFGVASYTVSKRLRELSIRVALGAQGKQVIWAALGRMLALLGCGSVAGLLLGVATSQILSAVVYQASAQDPVVLGAVALTILLTGGLSVAAPVRRALHADPALLLRDQ
ncbi:MAG: ABC transporter permease [Verrucomicrobia bacterium]|nr:ABC transporter permease [Verrucomicrobiota bacterium]